MKARSRSCAQLNTWRSSKAAAQTRSCRHAHSQGLRATCNTMTSSMSSNWTLHTRQPFSVSQAQSHAGSDGESIDADAHTLLSGKHAAVHAGSCAAGALPLLRPDASPAIVQVLTVTS